MGDRTVLGEFEHLILAAALRLGEGAYGAALMREIDRVRVPGRQTPVALFDILDYHTTPVEAAQVANEANVGLLVLYHLAPAPFNALLDRVFLRGVAEVRPDGVMLAEDGLLIELPTGSNEIVVGAID